MKKVNGNKIGVLLAPGRTNDQSMNQYVKESIDNFRGGWMNASYWTENPFFVKEPTSAAADIEKCLDSLISSGNCSEVHVLGEQCAPFVKRYLRLKSQPGKTFPRIIFANYPDQEPSDSQDIIDFTEGQYSISVQNYKENSLAYAFGMAVSEYAKTYCKKYGLQNINVAFISAAPVPIIARWEAGFTRGFKKKQGEASLHRYSLGAGYTKFDDPASGYELAKYLIDEYHVDFIVSVCGASGLGVVQAILEAGEKGKKIAYFPHDYYKWARYSLKSLSVPLSIVRRIDNRINPNLSLRRYDISGTIYYSANDDCWASEEFINSIKSEVSNISFESYNDAF